MIKILAKKRILKVLSIFLALNLMLEVFVPTIVYGLTNGPSQPEIQSFEPIGTSEMVNLFSGDFTYNIPLFELPGPNGGYPFNLAYNSGVGMDQEASWVGLGWNLQPGSMTRSMAGMPDEFDGIKDQVLRRMDMKADQTIGLRAGAGVELFGMDKFPGLKLGVDASLGIYNSSYKGVSTELSVGLNLSQEITKELKSKSIVGVSMGFNARITLNSQDGVDVAASRSSGLVFKTEENDVKQYRLDIKNEIGFNYNSRRGLQNMTTGFTVGVTGINKALETSEDQVSSEDLVAGRTPEATYTTLSSGSLNASNTITLATANTNYNPQITLPFVSKSFSADVKVGGSFSGGYGYGMAAVSFSNQELRDRNKWISAPAYGYLNLQNVKDNETNSILDYNRENDGIIRDESTNLWMPRLTYDAYSVTGHGMAGSFRPYRRDIGAVWDPSNRSESSGRTAGAEVGFGTFRVGGNYGQSKGHSESKKMAITANYDFKENVANNQMIIFKGHGEATTKKVDVWDHIGGYKPMRFKKNTSNSKHYKFENELEGRYPSDRKVMNNDNNLVLNEKESRNSVVLPIKNEDLLNNTSEEVLKEFNIDYYDHRVDEGSLLEEYVTGADGSDPDQLKVNDFSSIKQYSRTPTTVASVTEGFDIEQDIPEAGWVASNFKINKEHHNAGFLNVDPNGLRYVYGLPIYNTEQVDVSYSALSSGTADIIDIADVDSNGDPDYHAPNSDEYLSKTKIPPYAYAHMLTAILGVDYVDADDIPGPSDGDLGYWVKFNYRKVADDYQWRTPFSGAKYNPGIQNSTQDDRGSYTYGKKEVWYLATAETASHKAFFYIDKRNDARGAAQELQNNNEVDEYSYKLYKIELYSKLELDPTNIKASVPIKSINLAYNKEGEASFTLCKETANNALPVNDVKGGKLTLSKLWFEYRNHKLGEKTPYEFSYGKKPIDTDNFERVNPDYKPYNVDRWGNFRELTDLPNISSDASDDIKWQFQLDYPYVRQDTDRDLLDKYAYAWHLTDIQLPSGSVIKVEYEADDYAYVQNKQAMYMADIVAVSQAGVNGKVYGYDRNAQETVPFPTPTTDADKDAMMTLHTNEEGERTRIYFKLKNEVQPLANLTDNKLLQLTELKKYLDHTKQLYYKTKVHLHEAADNNYVEYVAGYAELESIETTADIGLHGALVGKSSEGNYTHAYVTVQRAGKGKKWHPFSLAAWQHIQINQPELYNSSPTVPSVESGDKKKIGVALGLAGMGNAFSQMVMGFYNWAAKEKQWGRLIETDKSWIRLNVPDKIKVGGGVRVKQIKLNDGWGIEGLSDEESNGVGNAEYGQVYDYTTVDEDGANISSGVAAFEPIMGGDETAIRSARKYSEVIAMRNNNDYFFELPVNQSFYPAASVGYSKVTVKSLASANARNKNANETPAGFHSTTGATVHEFYTAKDFPVITDETVKDDKNEKPRTKFKIKLREFFQNFISTQGYTVIQNNMHGKVKKTSNYGMDNQGNVNTEPISWILHEYKKEEAEAHGLPAYQLKNHVVALVEDEDGKQPYLEERILGEEMDFFVDARETEVFSETWGTSANTDMLIWPPFPVLTVIPNTTRTTMRSKSMSTNKVISRVGILDRVVAWSHGSTVSSANEVWDAQTGEVVVTSSNNSFGDKIYNYNIPAHLKYEGLGPAFKNIGMRIDHIALKQLIAKPDLYEDDGVEHEYKPNYYVLPHTDLPTGIAQEDFYPGDEFIVSADEYELVNDEEVFAGSTPVAKMIFVGEQKDYNKNPELAFYSAENLTELLDMDKVSLYLYRSGRRNLLSAKVGSIISMTHPLLVEKEGGAIMNKYDIISRNLSAKNLPAIKLPDCPRGDCAGQLGKPVDE